MSEIKSDTAVPKLVAFTSNTSHATLDGKRTLCGRTGWASEDPWFADGPDRLVCSRVLSGLATADSEPEHAMAYNDLRPEVQP